MDIFIIFAATEGLCIFALAHMRKAAHLIALVYSVIFSMRLILALLSKNTDAILLSTIGVVLCLFSFLYIWTNSEAPRIRYQRARWGKYFQRPIGERAGNVLSLFVLPLVAYWTENLICAYLSSIAVALAYSILVFPRLWASSLRDASDKISCDVFKKIRVMDLPEEIPEKYAATAGFINPVLIVSNHMLRLEKEEMRCILLHEVGHVRGKHYLIQSIYYAIGFSTSILLLLFISELLGWIWLLIFTITSSLLSHRQELLANAFVVREMGEGKTLIKTLRHLYEGKEGRASFINPSLSKMIREIETEEKRMLPETHGNP